MMKFLDALRWRDASHSYAQSGEDLIINFIAQAMRIENMTYLDVGAHHPVNLSNTYLFYKRGHRGVLVEPDPLLLSEIRKVRPRDICVGAGVGTSEAESARFFVMTARTLNTFSEAEAKRYEAMGTNRIEKVIDVPLVTVDSILAEHFPDAPPTVISIDVEGLDFEVLSTLDFQRHRAPIVCVETLSYSEDRKESKDLRIPDLMAGNGYFVYADTYINTIFVETAAWRSSGHSASPGRCILVRI